MSASDNKIGATGLSTLTPLSPDVIANLKLIPGGDSFIPVPTAQMTYDTYNGLVSKANALSSSYVSGGLPAAQQYQADLAQAASSGDSGFWGGITGFLTSGLAVPVLAAVAAPFLATAFAGDTALAADLQAATDLTAETTGTTVTGAGGQLLPSTDAILSGSAGTTVTSGASTIANPVLDAAGNVVDASTVSLPTIPPAGTAATQKLTLEQLTSLTTNPDALAQYLQAGMVDPTMLTPELLTAIGKTPGLPTSIFKALQDLTGISLTDLSKYMPAITGVVANTLQKPPQSPNVTQIDPNTGLPLSSSITTAAGTTVALDPRLQTMYTQVYDANKANLVPLTAATTQATADQQAITQGLAALNTKAADPSMNLDAALADYKSTTAPVTATQQGITDAFGNLVTKAADPSMNLDAAAASYKTGMSPTMATQQGITDTLGNLATKAGGMTLDPAVSSYKGVAGSVLGSQNTLSGQLGNLTQQASGQDLNLANALSSYQSGVTPIQGTQSDVLGKTQSLYGQAGANQGGYVQSVTDPVKQAAASAIGKEQLNQGLRGIQGSSFGGQNLAAIQTDAGRQIADATAKATQESLGLQSQLAGQELSTSSAQSQLASQNLQAENLAMQARTGQIGTQAGLIGTTGGLQKDILQTGAGILGAEQAGLQANMASLDEQAKLAGAQGQAAKDQQASLAALFGVDQAGITAKVNQLTQEATLTDAQGQAAKNQLASAQALLSAQQAGLNADQAQIAAQASLGSQMSQSVKDQLQTALVQFQAGDTTNANLLQYIGVLTNTDIATMSLGRTGSSLGATNIQNQNANLARLLSGVSTSVASVAAAPPPPPPAAAPTTPTTPTDNAVLYYVPGVTP